MFSRVLFVSMMLEGIFSSHKFRHQSPHPRACTQPPMHGWKEAKGGCRVQSVNSVLLSCTPWQSVRYLTLCWEESFENKA